VDVDRLWLGLARDIVLQDLLYQRSGCRVDANVILGRRLVPTTRASESGSAIKVERKPACEGDAIPANESVLLAVGIHLCFVLAKSLLGQVALYF